MAAKILLIAEAANPEWVSVPLVGWSLAAAIAKRIDTHLVTQIRNREALLRSGLVEGRDFTAIDSEAAARPLWRLANVLRGKAGGGWTLATAAATLAYYYFESLAWARFKPALLRGEFTVVHRITPLSPTTPSMLAKRCKRIGVPFVLGPINGGVPYPKGFESMRRQEGEWLSYLRSGYKLLPGYRSTLASASALLVASNITLRQIPPKFSDKCIYIPENGIDTTRFSGRANPSSSGPLRACFVGRLVPYKGPDILLEALAPILRSNRIEVDIIGDGPLATTLRNLVEREGLGQSVTMHGWVEHRKLQALMCRSRLLILPSVREFGGGVVLEAMALGLVPIVVNYGGPGELVTDQTGIRVPLGRRSEITANLRAAVEKVCDSPERLEAMARSAQTRVQNLFTWDAKAAQVMEVYEWVQGRRQEKPSFSFDQDQSPMPPY